MFMKHSMENSRSVVNRSPNRSVLWPTCSREQRNARGYFGVVCASCYPCVRSEVLGPIRWKKGAWGAQLEGRLGIEEIGKVGGGWLTEGSAHQLED